MTVPGNVNELLLRTAAAAGGYSIDRSLRFNAVDGASLTRTPGSAGNRKTWTWSAWAKLTEVSGSSSGNNYLFSAYGSGTTQLSYFDLRWQPSGCNLRLGGYNDAWRSTTAVFRDPSAWYHIVVTWDTTQSTASNRIKLYVNGVQQTAFSSSLDPALNDETSVNNTVGHTIGASSNCYLADIYFIDGSALTPSSFGETDATTGVWVPKAFTGTYGTQGWRLNFSDNSAATATTLGKDSSGNGNNWTPTNFSVTAGSGNDSLRDSPTNGTASTGGDAGGVTVGNYPTWNPLVAFGNTTLTNGNLDAVAINNNTPFLQSTIAFPSSGKWYFEVTCTKSSQPSIGIGNSQYATYGAYAVYRTSGSYLTFNMGATASGSGATYTTGDIIGVAYNADSGAITFYKNGAAQSGGFTTIPSNGQWFALLYIDGANDGGVLNAGQRAFAYAAPSGYKALCTANLPAPTIVKPSSVMDVKLYTGTGSTQTISGLGFNPDLVWIKSRSAATDHALYDTVRGVEKRLESNNDANQVSSDSGVTAFNSNGFSVGTLAQVNTSSATYCAWCWDGGTSNASNTSGGTTSTVRASISAGFSCLTYVGPGSNSTVGHGLGVAPSFIIVKALGSVPWGVYHSALGATKYLALNSTAAAGTSSSYWQNTSPTSSVFSIGTGSAVNDTGVTYLAYCWAAVENYSAFGSYTGNGSSDGPFVATSMRPRFLMVKRTDTAADWVIVDAARIGYNIDNKFLFPNGSYAESAGGTSFDLLSNGFKARGTNAEINASGGTYVYAAFSEVAFNFARAR